MKVLSEVRDVATGAVVEFGETTSAYGGRGYDIIVHSPRPFVGGDRGVDFEDPCCSKLGGRHCYYTFPNWWGITIGVIASWEAGLFDSVQLWLAGVLTEFCGVGNGGS